MNGLNSPDARAMMILGFVNVSSTSTSACKCRIMKSSRHCTLDSGSCAAIQSMLGSCSRMSLSISMKNHRIGRG